MTVDLHNLDIAKLTIRCYPDPVLLRSADPVEQFDADLADLADRMSDMMIEAAGIGLAAPQVGVSVRLIVISPSGRREDTQVIVNPELTDMQGWSESDEGCLSLPNICATVRRSASCTVNANDLQGNNITFPADELPARVIQHETDHLNGTLFIDRLSTVSRFACRKAIKQLVNNYSR